MALPQSPSGKNYTMHRRYSQLKQFGKIQCEYIWIGGTGLDIRSKTRTLKAKVLSVEDIPCWNYDGSSTGQADGSDSEIWLKPVKYCRDPFRGGDNILCLCQCLNASTMEPIETNRRAPALKVFEEKSVAEEEPWFGIEQEYTLFDSTGTIPLGWPNNGFPAPQGPYYCSVGANVAHGRHIVESHYKACLHAGLEISGVNAEVMAGQWEFQVGPCTGIDSGDQLWLARYLLNRVAEDFEVVVSYEPKPVKGDWNGAGAVQSISVLTSKLHSVLNTCVSDVICAFTGQHTNYSTKSMRADGGYEAILAAIKKLGEKHSVHMEVYGLGNEMRLTGKHETAKFDTFKYGVADRGASIRIPRQTDIDQKGYLEDRRPAANCDPYDVTAIIAKTTLLDDVTDID